ncbi:MAG TPA: hypothetical protein VN896_02400 [Methylomirabilota bacterium]|nr:hypothetical protein [Methylomirabilota bacterium]
MLGIARLLLVASLAGAAHAAEPAEPIAIVVAIRGKVTVTASGSNTPAVPARLGMGLGRGARISVGSRSTASLYFDDGRVIQLEGGSNISLTGRSTTDHRDRVAFGAIKLPIAGSRGALIPEPTLRSADEGPLPVPIAPRSSDVLATRPKLAWQSVPGATRYRVSVSGAQGVVWSGETGGTALDFPSDRPSLDAGDYLWEVRAHDGSGPLGTSAASFRVVPEVEAQAIRTTVDRLAESAGGHGMPAARYIVGAYLYQKGFVSEAMLEFEALARLVPDSPDPQRVLSEVYRTAGLDGLARSAAARADTLAGAR